MWVDQKTLDRVNYDRKNEPLKIIVKGAPMTHAIVKTPDGTTYVSPILALKFDGLRTLSVGLDESLTHVCLLKHWHTDPKTHRVTRGLFLLSNEDGNPSTGWVGADWFLRDKALFRRVTGGDRIPVADDPRFAPYASPITLPDWFEVKNEQDAADLECVSFDFHDSTVDTLTEEDGDWIIRFDTSWECIITVRFCGVTDAWFKDVVYEILDAEITKTAEGLTFTVLDHLADLDEDQEPPSHDGKPHIKCKRILWKIEIGQ